MVSRKNNLLKRVLAVLASLINLKSDFKNTQRRNGLSLVGNVLAY